MEHDLVRLKARLQELSAWRDWETVALQGDFKAADTSDWTPIQQGDAWPTHIGTAEGLATPRDRSFPVQMVFEGDVPENWKDKPVWVRLSVGGEGLLLMDGKAIGGLNPYHREYPLLESAKGGEVLALEVEAVPKGLFGVPVAQPKLEEAVLVIPDLQVRSLCTDIACVLDAAKHVQADVAALLLDALSSTFALISLPRSPAEAYLAQLQRSDWAAMNAQLWEEWKFAGAGVALRDEHRASLETASAYLREQLSQIRERYPSTGQLLLTGHAHIDLAWLWPVAETRRKIRRTFATVLTLMERYPDLYFNQSSAQAYAWIEQDDPELFAQIQQRVQEGRWDIVGGMWVEPDGMLLAGESWVRQILYGQRYFEEKFGKKASVAWLPDTFGFAANLPQLLQQGELPYFFTTKLGWNETNPFPHDLWQWEGLDGSRVLAHGFWNPNQSYNGRLEAYDLAATWKNFKGKRYHPTSLYAFGYGDGGGGPSAEMLERYGRYQTFPGLPGVRTGRVDEFYQEIAGEQGSRGAGVQEIKAFSPPLLRSSAPLPKWVGEQYLELHRATYTTQAQVKRLNRRLEQALSEAEIAWSLATLKVDAKLALEMPTYPAKELEAAWKTLLLNQFHDILPGSGVHSVSKEAVEGLQVALAQVKVLRKEALELLSSDIRKTNSEAVAHLLVWNLSSSPRPLRFRIKRPTEQYFRLINPDGWEVPYQEDGEHILVSSEHLVPAMGYWTLAIVTSLGSRKIPAAVSGSGLVLENAHLRAEVAPDGSIASLLDKDHQRLCLVGRGNQIWAYTDLPRFWEAWDVDGSYQGEGQEVLATQVKLIQSGSTRVGIWVERKIGESRLEQTYWLWAGSRRLEIETVAHWQERRTLLRALFPLNVRSHQAWYETAFGAVARPTHANTSWDAAQFEVPALRWADLSEHGYGVSLLNDSKYGHSTKGNVLGLSLLRGAIWPDPLADVGEHRFSYAIYPHAGDWRSGTLSEAEELNSPLQTVVLPSLGGTQAATGQLLRMEASSLRVSAFKRSEDGKAYILRLYEAHGSRGETTLDFSSLGFRSACTVNLLEHPDKAVLLEHGKLHLHYAPYQIISVRLEL